MQENHKNRTKENLILFAILVIVAFAVYLLSVNIRYSDSEKIQKLFLNTYGTVIDNKGCSHEVYVDSLDCIYVSDYSDCGWREVKAYVNVDTDLGTLQHVEVLIELPLLWLDSEVRWDYDCAEDIYYFQQAKTSESTEDEKDTTFYFEADPKYTVGEVMQYLGVYDSYQIACADVSTITSAYDGLEYCIIWRYSGDKQVYKNWVRAEYDPESGTWNLTDPIAKGDTLLTHMEDLLVSSDPSDFEPDEKYASDYEITYSEDWTSIEGSGDEYY